MVHKILLPFLRRRIKTDVGLEIPPKKVRMRKGRGYWTVNYIGFITTLYYSWAPKFWIHLMNFDLLQTSISMSKLLTNIFNTTDVVILFRIIGDVYFIVHCLNPLMETACKCFILA